jgi:HD-GYP domain-containing protein (c-di-GMP phosphodiesterase class II)
MVGETKLTLYTSPGVEVDLRAIDVADVEALALAEGAMPPLSNGPGVWVVTADEFGGQADRISATLSPLEVADHFAIVLVCGVAESLLTPEADRRVFAFLNPNAPPHLRAKVVRSALTAVRMTWQQEVLADDLRRRDAQLRELNEIGVALSAERDVDRLLDMILERSRKITGADAGSLYLIESAGAGEQRLRFKLSQNDSFNLNYSEFTIPLNTRSLAGYTGFTGQSLLLDDVYDLPPDVDYSFSRSWDEETGYRTRSMLVVPMRNNKGEMRGVLQLINRKRDPGARLQKPDDFAREVVPFDAESEQMVESLASQAAVALENQLLLKNISNIFEGVLMSWVRAVEDRDPATAGHSFRVTAMTLALAREVDKLDSGPYADVHFSRQQLEELRYAGMLHDIGKIYVRREVFLKAKKLYSHHLRVIEERFDFVRRTLEAEYSRRKLEVVLQYPDQDVSEHFVEIDAAHRRELEMINEYFDIILMANEPTVLPEDGFERLADVAAATYRDIYGNTQKLLQPDEVRLLSIRKGNLDEIERREIESHVSWSYKILSRIPWTPELQQIPYIAWAHHERLEGSGYPNGLVLDQISVQARMMAIADVFDALTAADRPYKKAQPTESALRILGFERDDRHIDPELLQLFTSKQIYRVATMEPVEDVVKRLCYEDVL